MEGYVDYLEDTGRVLHHRRWQRRFARLDAPGHALELFAEATTTHARLGRIELRHAQVATAEELGELLLGAAGATARVPVEYSRRFVFRINEMPSTSSGAAHGTTTTPRPHYLCAELRGEDPNEPPDPTASRAYLECWVAALRHTATRASLPGTSSATNGRPLDLRELNALIAAYVDHMHVSVQVCSRRMGPDEPHSPGSSNSSKKGQYELRVQAWTLKRELVSADEDADDPDASTDDGGGGSWQLLEYSCAWSVWRTSAELRDLDARLRSTTTAAQALRDLTLPTFSGVSAFLHVHSAAQREAEDQRRVMAYDHYVQELLARPALSAFGGDAGAMLDQFLELSTHFAAFKKLERDTGTNLHLRHRQLLPWHERERFEGLYRMHLEILRVQEERRQREQKQQQQLARARALAASSPHRHSHHHRRREREQSEAPEEQSPATNNDDVLAPPAPTPLAPMAPLSEGGSSVHERIARIGHKLLVEAFQSTSMETDGGGPPSASSLRRPSPVPTA